MPGILKIFTSTRLEIPPRNIEVYKKSPIPKPLKKIVWETYVGKKYSGKCYVKWCKTHITTWDWECGHNIPESKNGPTSIENLRPICSGCNRGMGNRYTIDEWSRMYSSKSTCCYSSTVDPNAHAGPS